MGAVKKVVKKVSNVVAPVATVASFIPPLAPIAAPVAKISGAVNSAFYAVDRITGKAYPKPFVSDSNADYSQLEPTNFADSAKFIREEQQLDDRYTNYATGLVNYLNRLKRDAPEMVERYRSKLTSGYQQYYTSLQSEINQEKSIAKEQKTFEPAGTIPNNNGSGVSSSGVSNGKSTYTGPRPNSFGTR